MMINVFLQHPEDPLRWSRNMHEMESPDSSPEVQYDIDAIGRRSTLSIAASRSSPMSSSFLIDEEYNLSRVSGSMRVTGWAGPCTVYCLHSDPRVILPDISVITSSNSRKRGQSPSLQVWDLRPSRVAHPDTSASSNTHLPTTPTLYHLKLAFFGIALHCTDITANYSINSKINDNNKNTVKSRLVLGKINYIEHKGIKYLIYNISLILCVPQFIKNNSNVYANISKLKQRNYEVVEMTINTKKNGAFPQIQENLSQSVKKNVVNDCDLTLIIKCILINQNFGRMPENSIPVLKNAITVQGIVYGHPHSHNSFNPKVIFSGEAACLLLMNKSDYAFIDKTRIIIHSVLNESETVSRKLLVYLKLTKENKMLGNSKVQIKNDFQYFTKNSNMLYKSLGYSEVDNKHPEGVEEDNCVPEGTLDDRDGAECIEEKKTEYATFSNGEFTFKSLLKMVGEAPSKIAQLFKERGPQAFNAWNVPKILQLAGGGESSLNAASGWGSPPNANNNNGVGNNWGGNNGGNSQPTAANNIQQQWASANQRPPTSQDANTNKVNNVSSSGSGSSTVVSPSGPTGNWGSSASNSNMPVSSQSNNSSQPMPPVQAGTGGNSPGANGNGAPPMPPNNTVGPVPGTAPPPTTSKAQLEQLSTMREALFSQDGWGGHVNQDTNWDVPTSPEPGVKLDQTGGPPVWKPNINNGTDLWEANLRNGGQPPPQPVAKTPWGHTPTTNIGGTWGEDDDAPESSNVWTGPPPPQWGAPPHQPPHWNAAGKKDDWVGWGEPHRPDIHRPDMHGRDLRAPAPDHRDMRTMMNMDGRGGDMRGDPRGISGRLNGGDMWGQHHGMPHGMQAPNKMMPTNVGNGVNQWGAQAPKDMNMPKGGSGWEEPSPPAARRNMANFDDGTSLWGQQRGSGVAPWKDVSGGMGRGAMQCPPVMPPNRMPGVGAPNPMKPDAMWGHPHRNGSWEESSAHSGNWEKDGGNSWNDTSMNQGGGWIGQKTKPMGAPGGSWDSDMGDWGGPKPPGGGGSTAKLLPKDMIWNSKQFRLLVDMGYKKDDVELALRNRDMNVDDAMDMLASMRGTGGMDTWRRLEDHPGGPPFDHQQQYPAPPRHQPPSFPPPQQPPSVPFPQPSQGLVSNISPAIPKILSSQPTSQPPPSFNQQNNQTGGSGQPSTAQLRMLVQQIQMAVSAGYLNHQILNQPLAPQTLVLLNQLLQQIKLLQQLGSQHSAVMQNSMGGKNNSSVSLHITGQINKAKQQIVNLQGQIAAQQAIYIKQQANATGGTSSGSGDFFNKPQDPLTPLPQLQNNFADLTLNKDAPTPYGGSSGQQSRLNQWKLPSLDKDEGSEFSRAPGTTTKSTTSPQLNPLALQPDSTWSTGRSVNDGWPSSDASDLPDGKEPWPTSQPPQSATYDLVPEFEPGKPWKGNQMKNIEDDPAITPGSVVRSPLSLAAIKDTDIFGTSNQSKPSPTTPSERTLSSSTWSYPPPSSTPNSFNIAKGGGTKSWGDTAATGQSELWGSGSSMPKSRGPLPASSSKPAPGWGGSSTQPQRSAFSQQPNWQSTWLLLKNLTAQIDGSTLKTLCLQHGPLQSFHLYLNQGIALSKYNTREEASKAQTALNNCVLGNTTIFAESPAESDVNMILQHLGQGAGGSQWRNSGGKGAAGPPASDTWNFTSLWDTPLAEQRATPSSLTTFLPPDLLGGESI